MHTKYEVSMPNPMAGEVCTDDEADANDANTNDDRQSMIAQGSLVDKPNEPKITRVSKLYTTKASLTYCITLMVQKFFLRFCFWVGTSE